MSDDSPLTPDQFSPKSVGPFTRLIAEALPRFGSLGNMAAAVTQAAYDLDRTTTTVHPSAVHGWVHGVIAQPKLRRWIAHACNIPFADLNRAADLQRGLRAVRQPSRVVPQAPGEPVESEEVKRRAAAQFLALFGVSAFTGIEFDHYAAVLAGTRADERALDDFETITRDLIRREATVSPQALMPAVRGHLAYMRDVLVWTPPALASRAYSLAGHTALLTGYLLFKQGTHADAEAYWSLADRLGDMAGDVRVRAMHLVLAAKKVTDLAGDLSTTLALLDRADSILGPAPEPALAALILSRRAPRRAEASQADHAHTVPALRDIDDAQVHLSRLAQTDTGMYLFQSLTDEVTERRAEALLHLDRPQAAVAELDRLLASMDPVWLSARSWAMSYLAAAHAKMGDHEHACGLLLTSLRLAMDASSPAAVEAVRCRRQQWLDGYDGPAVRGLDEHLQAIPA